MYAVGHIYLTTEVNLYGKSGLHLRTIGREGSGPGEFRNLITLATLGDSLFVYDNSLLRETVFDFRGNLLRDRRVLPRIFRAVPTASGQLAMNAQDVSPGRVGAPLHVVDGTGSHVRSFPNAGGRYRADEAQLFRRALARSMDARFWSAYPTKYEVEQWDLSGTLTARVERVVDWFRPHQQRQVYRPGVEPLPRVWDIHEDRDGRLWVLLHVVDDRWPSTLRPTPNPELSFNGNLDLYWDSVVEVLDPIRGVLIGRTRSDTYFAGFTTAGQLMSYHEPDQGEPFITVWNVSIR